MDALLSTRPGARRSDMRVPIPAASPMLAALAFALILLARNPAIVTHARFWAEDGWAFYPEAYRTGWHSLAIPLAGYLQTASRLGALAAQPFPLAWAPTLFALMAVAAQVAPAAFLVSARMDRAWPSRWGRMLFALAYLALPNDREVFVNLTNAQWHLAILAFLVLASAPARHWTGRAFDAAALILSGLSGPFVLLLAPTALWQHRAAPSRTTFWRGALLLALIAIQAAILLGTLQERHSGPLGATLPRLARVVGLQVFAGLLVDQATLETLSAWPPWRDGSAAIWVCVAGALMVTAAARTGPRLLRQMIVLAILLDAAALARPQVSEHGIQWLELCSPGVGSRYWEIPTLAWLGALFVLSARARPPLRLAALGLIGAMALGVSRGWNIPIDPPTAFTSLARAFDAAPPGTVMEFPVRPAATGRPMVLVKMP